MNIDAIKSLRKELHAKPELSGEEEQTAQRIEQELHNIGNISVFRLGKHSLLGRRFFNEQGPHVMFRCELDALPIQEINDFEHQSEVKGVSHKCGHDGHMAVMMALAHKVAEKGFKRGSVSYLFQSAEENGKGAEEIVNNNTFQGIDKADYIFALHNVPGYPINQVIVKESVFTPSVVSVEVQFTGKTSHAAEPEKGINPAYAMAELLMAIKEKQQPNEDAEDFSVLTPVYAELGEKSYGVSAGEGMLGITIRCWKSSYRKELEQWLKEKLTEIAENYGLKTEQRWFESFESVENDPEASRRVEAAAKELSMNLHIKDKPFKWGEDFGLYTQKFKGAMFGLGAGVEQPALHNPDYDFPDDLIESGSDIFLKILENILDES